MNLAKFRAERKRISEESDKYKEIGKVIDGMTITTLPEDLTHIQQDSVRQKRIASWHKSLSKDAYLNEVMNIMDEMK